MEIYKAQDYVLKRLKKLGVDDVVISATTDESNQIKYVNNEIATTKRWISDGISVFAAIGKKNSMTNIRAESKSQIDKTLNKLVKIVKNNPENKEYMGIAKGPFKYKKVNGLYDKKIKNLNSDGVDIIKDSLNKALDIGASRSSGVFDTEISSGRLLTSNGVDADIKDSFISFSIRSFIDGNASSHKISVATTLRRFDPIGAAKNAASTAVKACNPKNINAGKYDVLFDPLAFSNILERVAWASSISYVEAGFSFLANKLNKKVANTNFTMYDQGNLDYGLASSSFDGEGTPTQKTTIIDKGIFKTYLHNYSTANRYNTKSTGNAGLVSPNPTNIILKPGKASIDGLLKKIKKGLYITNVWYTRFQNYSTGEFSTIPRDAIFYIENGKIKHAVKGIRITESMLNILNNISGIGKESQTILGWEVETPCECPPVLVRKVNITKPKET